MSAFALIWFVSCYTCHFCIEFDLKAGWLQQQVALGIQAQHVFLPKVYKTVFAEDLIPNILVQKTVLGVIILCFFGSTFFACSIV